MKTVIRNPVAFQSRITASWQKRYTPFGDTEEESGTIENTYSFTGKGYDPDSRLYYFNARWYDADVGRFISEDPLWGNILDPQSLNRFAYGRNNPFRFTDPTGLELEEALIESGWLMSDGEDDGDGSGPNFVNEDTDLWNDEDWELISELMQAEIEAEQRIKRGMEKRGTVGIGPSCTGGYGKGGTGGFQVVSDKKGNVGLLVYGGVGAYASATPGATCGLDGTITNAETIYDLEGAGGQTGVSAGPGAANFSGEGVYGNGYSGGNVNIGFGTPGASGTSFITGAKVYTLW